MSFVGGIASIAGVQNQTAYTGGLFPAPTSYILREDLLDAAMNLDKKKKAAVFLAMPKTTSNGLIHEWLIDNLPSTATGGAVEGDDWASAGDARLRTRLYNVVQTFKRNFAVSLDQIEYSLKGRAPGVSNEYTHQVGNFLVATEQSMDARVVALGAGVVATTAGVSTNAPLMGTIRNWEAIGVTSTAAQNNATSVCQINVGGAWSRSKFLALHEFMFGIGADPDTLACSPGVKSDITQDILGETLFASGFVSSAAGMGFANPPSVVRQLHTDGSGTEYTQDIQFMRTDFGRVAILVDRFIPESSTTAIDRNGAAYFLYERANLRMAFWRPLRHYPLPPTGDSARGYVHCGATLELLHPGTMGVGKNVTT